MYVKDGQEVPNPDSTSGLYIRRQDGTTVQVKVPADHIAFQMGEAMQAGFLRTERLGFALGQYVYHGKDYVRPRAQAFYSGTLKKKGSASISRSTHSCPIGCWASPAGFSWSHCEMRR